MKLNLFNIFIGMLALAPLCAEAKIERDYATSCTGVLTLVCDSIDYRSDLTRVYGRITGRPHTSGRIDSLTLVTGGKAYISTDIDGVDMKRYFQWEDDGVIPVEIDFAPMKPVREAIVKAGGPRGESQWTIRRKK